MIAVMIRLFYGDVSPFSTKNPDVQRKFSGGAEKFLFSTVLCKLNLAWKVVEQVVENFFQSVKRQNYLDSFRKLFCGKPCGKCG